MDAPNSTSPLVSIIAGLQSIGGRYTDVMPLGDGLRGSFSLTFSAKDRQEQCAVVLKFLKPDIALATGPNYRRQCFQREIEIAAAMRGREGVIELHDGPCNETISLTHAGGLIVPIPLPYAVFKKATHDLATHMLKEELGLKTSLGIVRQLVKGVNRIHGFKFCHRDLKPENVFVFRGGEIRVGDYGTARRWDMDDPAFQDDYHGPVGDLRYVAPELVFGQWNDRSLFVAADWFSVGAVMFELVTGANLYTVLGLRADVRAIVHTLAGIPEAERRGLYDRMVKDIAGQYPIPALADALTDDRHTRYSATTLAAAERTMRSLLHFNPRRRETRFTRILAGLDIAIGHANEDEKKFSLRSNHRMALSSGVTRP